MYRVDPYYEYLEQEVGKYERKGDSFGDTYFLYSFLSQNGLLSILSSLLSDPIERETFLVYLFYTHLCHKPGLSELDWYNSSIIRLIYPQADLSEENLEKLYEIMAQKEFQQSFFQKYTAWIKEHYEPDKAILIGEDIINDTIDPNRDFLALLLTGIKRPENIDPQPFQLLFAFQKKSGLPLYYVLPQKEWILSEDVKEGVELGKECDLSFFTALLKQDGAFMDLARGFYQDGKPVMDYLIWLDYSHLDLDRLLGLDPFDQPIDEETLVTFDHFHYQPFFSSIDLESAGKKEQAWFYYFRPLPQFSVNWDEEDEDEYLYEPEEVFSMPLISLLSLKKRKARLLLSRLKQPKADRIIDYLYDRLHFQGVPNKLLAGPFFAVFVGACFQRIIEIAYRKAGVKKRTMVEILDAAKCTIYKNKVKVTSCMGLGWKCCHPLGIAWPKEIKLKDGLLDFSQIIPSTQEECEAQDY